MQIMHKLAIKDEKEWDYAYMYVYGWLECRCFCLAGFRLSSIDHEIQFAHVLLSFNIIINSYSPIYNFNIDICIDRVSIGKCIA